MIVPMRGLIAVSKKSSGTFGAGHENAGQTWASERITLIDDHDETLFIKVPERVRKTGFDPQQGEIVELLVDVRAVPVERRGQIVGAELALSVSGVLEPAKS